MSKKIKHNTAKVNPFETFYKESIKKVFSLKRAQELVDNVPDEAVGIGIIICEGELAQLLCDLNFNEVDTEDDGTSVESVALTLLEKIHSKLS